MSELNINSQIVSQAATKSLMQDLRQIIEQARGRVAATANYELTMMYWHIGERINREVLGNLRANYGKKIVVQVARQLQEEYGKKGFDEKSIRRMMQFATLFPEKQIVAQLARRLFWSHFIEVLPLKDSLQREFYITMAASERWGRDRLRKEIDNMLYERTAISGRPDELIKKELSTLRDDNTMTPDLVFKSPYFLEFTGLKGFYSEKTLEDCLVAHLEQFIIELGNGFSFVARQKRMIIDGEDFKLDLLFYHRRLHRLIAIDLKLGRFKAEYKGQMELYLRWLEQNEMELGEETPLGLLLCTEGSEEQIELLQLDKSGIKVAQYMTELPPREILQRQIQKSLAAAKERLANYEEDYRMLAEKIVVQDEVGYSITELGALLFAKRLSDFDDLRRKMVRVIVYKGKSKLDKVREQSFDAGYAISFKTMVEWINSQLPANEEIGQALRSTVTMYPEIAVREIVANMLVHQDFSEKGFPMVEIYSDRIDVSNPGQPIISVERFIDEYNSRNSSLADLIRRLGICEELGSGLDKAVAAIELFQLPPLRFTVQKARTTVTLCAYRKYADFDRQERIYACYQHACLKFVTNDKMTNLTLRERLGIDKQNYPMASRIIKDALIAGKIKEEKTENQSRNNKGYVPFWA